MSEINISDLREKANSGSVVAQSVLGICYLHGTDSAALDFIEQPQ
jgi:hypothetical protein